LLGHIRLEELQHVEGPRLNEDQQRNRFLVLGSKIEVVLVSEKGR
jgi:hypothetical protein